MKNKVTRLIESVNINCAEKQLINRIIESLKR